MSGTSLAGLLDPSPTASVGLDSFQGAQKPPILQPVLVYSSAGLANQPHPVPQPVRLFLTHQVASSIVLVFQTPQHLHQITQTTSSKHLTLVLSAGPTVSSTQASSWDTTPPHTGDQGYVSPLIDPYPERDSDLEALYENIPEDWEPVLYKEFLDAVSGSEADPVELESICSEDQSYRETVQAVSSLHEMLLHPRTGIYLPFSSGQPLDR